MCRIGGAHGLGVGRDLAGHGGVALGGDHGPLPQGHTGEDESEDEQGGEGDGDHAAPPGAMAGGRVAGVEEVALAFAQGEVAAPRGGPVE